MGGERVIRRERHLKEEGEGERKGGRRKGRERDIGTCGEIIRIVTDCIPSSWQLLANSSQ